MSPTLPFATHAVLSNVTRLQPKAQANLHLKGLEGELFEIDTGLCTFLGFSSFLLLSQDKTNRDLERGESNKTVEEKSWNGMETSDQESSLLFPAWWCLVVNLWFVVCGLWFVVCGLWCGGESI